MKIKFKDFRVPEGGKVKLKEWPTLVDPVYQSKAEYKKLLKAQVGELSALQHLHYASNRYAVLDLSGHGRCRQGWRYPARDVRRQSPGLPGV